MTRERRGPAATPGPNKVILDTATTGIVPRSDGTVSLDLERHYRRLRLTSSVAVPCTGVCTCWGAPLGGWSA